MIRTVNQANRRAQSAKKEEWQTATASPLYIQRKRAACLRLARECSRASWQQPEHRAEFLRVKREAMTDARAWAAL